MTGPPDDRPDFELRFPFEFFVEGTPVASSNSGRSKWEWIELVQRTFAPLLPEDHWATDNGVYVTILYFPDAPMRGDVDNIVKWIVDAMRPDVFIDDSQVERVIVQKFEPGRDASFLDPSPVLSAALEKPRPIVSLRVDDDLSAERIWE